MEDVFRITTIVRRRNSKGTVRYGTFHRARCILAANPDAKVEMLTGEFQDVTHHFKVGQNEQAEGTPG
jgi:hypothetical protein